MKKLVLFGILFTFFSQPIFAQKDTTWHTGGLAALNFNQTSLTNWASGGENSLATSGLINLFAKYKKTRTSWDNSLDLAYGILKSGDRKSVV